MLPATLTRRSFLGLLAAVPAAAVAATLPTNPGPCPKMRAALGDYRFYGFLEVDNDGTYGDYKGLRREIHLEGVTR